MAAQERAAYRRGLVRAASIAGVILLIVAGLGVFGFRQSRIARQSLYVADMNLAAQAWGAGNLHRARELLDRHRPRASRLSILNAQPSIDLPGFEWRLLWGLAHEDHSKFSFNTGTNGISCVALSTEGKYLAWGSIDGTARIIDLTAQREFGPLGGHADGVSSLAFSADARWLATGSGGGIIKLWAVGSWQERRVFTGHTKAVGYVGFHPNGGKLISSGADSIRLWALGPREEVEVIQRPDSGDTLSADGTLLAAYGGLNNSVRFWKLGGQNEQLPSLPPQKSLILSVAFFPDAESAIVSAHDSSITRWDLASMKPQQTYRQKAVVRGLALSANGKTLATASTDNLIKLWDAESGQELRTLRGHTSVPTRLALSADGGTLVSASAENTIKVWDTRARYENNVLPHQSLILNMALSRDGNMLATSDPNFHTISLWEVPSQRLVYSYTDPEHKARATVALSPDGKWLAVKWFNRDVLELWDISTEPYKKGPTLAVGFSLGLNSNFAPDGQILAFHGTDGAICLWDVTGQKLFCALANHGGVCATAFTADSKIIATSSDREIRLWDVQSQRRLSTFNAPRGSLWSLSFSRMAGCWRAGPMPTRMLESGTSGIAPNLGSYPRWSATRLAREPSLFLRTDGHWRVEVSTAPLSYGASLSGRRWPRCGNIPRKWAAWFFHRRQHTFHRKRRCHRAHLASADVRGDRHRRSHPSKERLAWNRSFATFLDGRSNVCIRQLAFPWSAAKSPLGCRVVRGPQSECPPDWDRLLGQCVR